MADKSYKTMQQHQPLRVPTGWNHEERSLVMQIEELLDELYQRCGFVRTKDNGRTLTIDSIVANQITANNIDCPDSIPNIVHSETEPDPGNNTIWLEPQTGTGTSVAYTDSRTIAAAAANSCPERKRPTFTYTAALSSPLDLTDAQSLTFTGKMHRNGNDFGQTFTVTAKLKFSDGTYKSLGQVGSGRTKKDYNLSGSLTLSTPIKKTVVAVVYIVTVQDNYGYMCSFYAGDNIKIAVAGEHPSQAPSDVVTVHYIP